MTQDQTFQESESDCYFRRNAKGIHGLSLTLDPPLRLIRDYNLKPASVLEVGAANGYRLAAIQERCGAHVVAVEPSAAAIADGVRRYPKVEFHQTTMADMELHEQFDLVIVHYVFHWIDRSRLLESIARLDRTVADGGHLILGDFAPTNRMKVPYHHRDGLHTYKQDYAGIFMASGLYHAVGYVSGPHGPGELNADVSEQERAGCWLMQKRLQDHYSKSEGV